MSELIEAAAEHQEVAKKAELFTEAPSRPPVVITEQEVLFGTAAAVPLPRKKPTRGVIAASRAMFLSSSADALQAPHHYPPRRAEFLEQAAMAREMRRL